MTASRASKTSYSRQNHRHHKENAEQKLALQRDQCPSPLHQDAHHLGEQPEGAHPAGDDQAVLQIGPQPQEQRQEGACREKPREEAHPEQSTEILPPAEQGPQTAQRTTTTATDHLRNTKHRTAPQQQGGEQISTQPAPPATKWSKKRLKQ
jgi:hypothetical protein